MLQKPLLSSIVIAGALHFCQALLGDKTADPQKYPFLVSIKLDTGGLNLQPYFRPQFGALLTMEWVLTTNELVFGSKMVTVFTVLLQRNQLDRITLRAEFLPASEGQKRHPKEWMNNFHDQNSDTAVTLVKANEPFQKSEFASAIKLPRSSDLGKVCDRPVLLGLFLAGNEKSFELQTSPVALRKSKEKCAGVGDTSLCAIGKTGLTKEDLGVPLICEGDTIVGVALGEHFAPVGFNLRFIKSLVPQEVQTSKPQTIPETTTSKRQIDRSAKVNQNSSGLKIHPSLLLISSASIFYQILQ